jgi:hypothetical protein
LWRAVSATNNNENPGYSDGHICLCLGYASVTNCFIAKPLSGSFAVGTMFEDSIGFAETPDNSYFNVAPEKVNKESKLTVGCQVGG